MFIKRKYFVSACLIAIACGSPSISDSPEAPPAPNKVPTSDDVNRDEPGEDGALVPEFGVEKNRKLVVVATSKNGLKVPRSLEFNPERPEELWIVNRAFDGTVMITNPGSVTQKFDVRADTFGDHFMEEVSSLSFGEGSTFATCQESRNTYNNTKPANNFMGPTLWPSTLSIYAKVNQDRASNTFGMDLDAPKSTADTHCTSAAGLQGSHLDMLHQSPLCMGIAHQSANQFWVFDGYNGHVVFYDFKTDHGPGYDYHEDGVVRRYPELSVTRVANVPGHLIVDKTTNMLYVADTGGGRILRMDTKTGKRYRSLTPSQEVVSEMSEFRGATVDTLVKGLKRPSGIAINGKRLFVSDNATGEIIALELNTGIEIERIQTGAKSIMGITVSPTGVIWFVDAEANTVSMVKPK